MVKKEKNDPDLKPDASVPECMPGLQSECMIMITSKLIPEPVIIQYGKCIVCKAQSSKFRNYLFIFNQYSLY